MALLSREHPRFAPSCWQDTPAACPGSEGGRSLNPRPVLALGPSTSETRILSVLIPHRLDTLSWQKGPPGRPRFYGEAQLVEDPQQREAVYQRVVPEEQSRDPEKTGYAVLIRVDRIRQGPRSVTR